MSTLTSCLRPDGKWCNHPKDSHRLNADMEKYQYMLGIICHGCWEERGHEPIGPSLHKYNPHILTPAGWLPVDKSVI